MIDLPPTPIGLDDLPGPLRARVEAEMAPGERLLWAGRSGSRPERALPDPRPWWAIGLASLTICISTVGVGSGLIRLDAFWVRLASPVAVLSGFVAFVILPNAFQLWDRRRRNRGWQGRALYALTDRRAILWMPSLEGGVMATAVLTVEPSADLNIHRIDYPEGTSEVYLGHLPKFRDEFNSSFPLEFVGIDQARVVERLARQVLGRRDKLDRSAVDRSHAESLSPFVTDDIEEPR